MKQKIIQQSFTQKDGTVWEWNETPELRAYIAQEQSKQIVQVNLNEGPKRAS